MIIIITKTFVYYSWVRRNKAFLFPAPHIFKIKLLMECSHFFRCLISDTLLVLFVLIPIILYVLMLDRMCCSIASTYTYYARL